MGKCLQKLSLYQFNMVTVCQCCVNSLFHCPQVAKKTKPTWCCFEMSVMKGCVEQQLLKPIALAANWKRFRLVHPGDGYYSTFEFDHIYITIQFTTQFELDTWKHSFYCVTVWIVLHTHHVIILKPQKQTVTWHFVNLLWPLTTIKSPGNSPDHSSYGVFMLSYQFKYSTLDVNWGDCL